MHPFCFELDLLNDLMIMLNVLQWILLELEMFNFPHLKIHQKVWVDRGKDRWLAAAVVRLRS